MIYRKRERNKERERKRTMRKEGKESVSLSLYLKVQSNASILGEENSFNKERGHSFLFLLLQLLLPLVGMDIKITAFFSELLVAFVFIIIIICSLVSLWTQHIKLCRLYWIYKPMLKS